MLIAYGEWTDADLGESKLKGLAEALRVNIEVINWDLVDQGPMLYSAQPDYTPSRRNMPKVYIPPVRLWSKEPSRLLLYNHHYYPLFPKGRFPNKRPLPGHKGASRFYESFKFSGHNGVPAGYDVRKTRSHGTWSAPIPDSDQTHLEPQTRIPPEELWELTDTPKSNSVERGNVMITSLALTSQTTGAPKQVLRKLTFDTKTPPMPTSTSQ